MTGGRTWRSSYGYVLWVCLGLVVLADWLFYQATVGWTVAMFVGVVAIAMTVRKSDYLRTRQGWAGIVAVGGIVVAMALEPSRLSVTLGAMLLAFIAMLNSDGWCWQLTEWTIRWIKFAVGGWGKIILDNRIASAWSKRSGRGDGKMARQWVVPIVLGFGFLMLFALANPVISDWISHGWDHLVSFLKRIPEFLAIARLTLWAGVAMGVWMLLRMRVGRSRQAVAGADWLLAELTEAMTPAADLVVRCLVVFNVVFAIETVLDVYYLWGGATLPAGMDYRTYAHRGAYPLIAAALLAGAFVVVTFPTGGLASQLRVARGLVYAWLAQTIFLTVSAAWRLALYVSVDQLTRWRLASTIWMGLVAFGLGAIIWRLVRRKSNEWLFAVNILATAAVLYACCFLNLDGFIAQWNVEHCAQAGGRAAPLDFGYMRELGPAALPAMKRFVGMGLAGVKDRGPAREALIALEDELRDEISDWRGWTIRRGQWARSLGAGDGGGVVADKGDGQAGADHF